MKKVAGLAYRAAIYVRVSTARQVEPRLSIPDQKKQAEAFCVLKGYRAVEIFEERGASAVTDRRPQFRRMMEMASWTPAPFDLIIVHSYSRFFRDQFELEANIRALAKNGIKLISITQMIGDDPMAEMMRHIIGLFDEYQSKETGKHVRRAQRENARQGFWNGSVPPVGYRAVVVEKRGLASKRRLEIDPLHADTIRLIYRLSLGRGGPGPLGVARIAAYLNDRKIPASGGGYWGLAAVYRVLRRRLYTGELVYDARGLAAQAGAKDEIIRTAVPPIIDRETFDAVQALLDRRGVISLRVPGRRTQYLLKDLVYCGKCGARLYGAVGGSGYKSYVCSARVRHGAAACSGLILSALRLEGFIKDFVQERLLQPAFLAKTLDEVLLRYQAMFESFDQQVGELHAAAEKDSIEIARHLGAIEDGRPGCDDLSARKQLPFLQTSRDGHLRAAEHARQQRNLFPRKVMGFDDLARTALQIRSDLLDHTVSYRGFAKLAIDEIKVTEEKISITGSRSGLLAALTGDRDTLEKRRSVFRERSSRRDRFRITMPHELKTSRRKVREP